MSNDEVPIFDNEVSIFDPNAAANKQPILVQTKQQNIILQKQKKKEKKQDVKKNGKVKPSSQEDEEHPNAVLRHAVAVQMLVYVTQWPSCQTYFELIFVFSQSCLPYLPSSPTFLIPVTAQHMPHARALNLYSQRPRQSPLP